MSLTLENLLLLMWILMMIIYLVRERSHVKRRSQYGNARPYREPVSSMTELITEMKEVRQDVDRLTNVMISHSRDRGQAVLGNYEWSTSMPRASVLFAQTLHGAPYVEVLGTTSETEARS